MAGRRRPAEDPLLIDVRGIGLLAVAVALAAPAARADDWPSPAERSGPRVPAPFAAEATATLQGAYVPASSWSMPEATGTFGGVLTWCFSPAKRLALFGRHGAARLWWGDVSLLALGHEIGLRWAAARRLTFEAAYLTHRVDRAWIDGFESRPGGVADAGGEAGVWLPFAPHPRIRIDVHLLWRAFDVYRDTQGVLGAGVRLTLRIGDGHAIAIDLAALRTQRSQPRAGVDRITWNAVGEVGLRSRLGRHLGWLIGARLSTSMLVGEQPMLELKRSMIDEPMAIGYLGVFFGL